MNYTREALLDLHERCHRSLKGFLAHCRVLTAAEVDRELEGFGQATIREQLHHLIGAERYWISVARGAMDAGEDEADAASIEALEAFRRGVFDATRAFLGGVSDEELNTQQLLTTWGGHEKMLAPAHIILRTQTHLFQHMGQIAAMCRLLGHPVEPGLDFPVT